MKPSQIWTFEDFSRKFLSYNSSELRRVLEQKGYRNLVGSKVLNHSRCPLCFRGSDPLEEAKRVDLILGTFSCSDCGRSGDLIDLLSAAKYGGVKEREQAIYDLAFDFRIMPDIRIGVYKHYKGHYYLVSGVARDDGDNGHWRVLYRPLYGDNCPTLRTIKNFFEHVPEANCDRFTFAYAA